MKKTVTALIILSMSVFVLISCGPSAGSTTLTVNGTVPGSLTASVALARSIAPRAVSQIDIPVEYPAGTSVGLISLTTARLVLKEFEIEQETVEDAEVEYEFNGPYVVDLLAGTMDPEPAPVDLPAGAYSQVKFKIDAVEGDEVDEEDGTQLVDNADPLFGHSILLGGTYTPSGGSAAAFEYTFDIDAEFELKAADETAVPFELSALGVNDIIVSFRLARWFDGMDPAAFAADPAAFSEALKENIKLSADYGKDEDGDGVLGSDEDDDSDTEDAEDD